MTHALRTINDREVPTMRSEFITFGPVHLDIRDRERSVAFWRDMVGLELFATANGSAALGIDGTALVVLHPGATQPVQRGYAGLYHLAIHLPSEPELARVVERLRYSHQRIGATDHIVAKSIYVNDPDGIGIELAFETPERVRSVRWDADSAAPIVIDSNGRQRSGVEPLDVAEVIAKLPDNDLARPLPSGTIMGHLHLQVADLDSTYSFYRDQIGLQANFYAPVAGYGDLGAGGRVSHRIAVNTWQSLGAPQRPAGAAGMRSFTMRFETPEGLRDAITRTGATRGLDDEYLVHDPAGNAFSMRGRE